MREEYDQKKIRQIWKERKGNGREEKRRQDQLLAILLKVRTARIISRPWAEMWAIPTAARSLMTHVCRMTP